MKLEELKCEFCDGNGDREINVDGMDCPSPCSFCNETGIDDAQLQKLFYERYSSTNPCSVCGCSIDAHRDDMTCPDFAMGNFYGWLETKFIVKP